MTGIITRHEQSRINHHATLCTNTMHLTHTRNDATPMTGCILLVTQAQSWLDSQEDVRPQISDTYWTQSNGVAEYTFNNLIWSLQQCCGDLIQEQPSKPKLFLCDCFHKGLSRCKHMLVLTTVFLSFACVKAEHFPTSTMPTIISKVQNIIWQCSNL